LGIKPASLFSLDLSITITRISIAPLVDRFSVRLPRKKAPRATSLYSYVEWEGTKSTGFVGNFGNLPDKMWIVRPGPLAAEMAPFHIEYAPHCSKLERFGQITARVKSSA
jgi:hypothetical protein